MVNIVIVRKVILLAREDMHVYMVHCLSCVHSILNSKRKGSWVKLGFEYLCVWGCV